MPARTSEERPTARKQQRRTAKTYLLRWHIIMDRCLRFINIVRKKKLTDVSLFLLLSVSIAVYSYVNIFYILPYMYQQLLSVWWMMVHVLPMAFVFFNLIANFIAIIHADSSILGRLLPLPTLKSIEKTYLNNNSNGL